MGNESDIHTMNTRLIFTLAIVLLAFGSNLTTSVRKLGEEDKMPKGFQYLEFLQCANGIAALEEYGRYVLTHPTKVGMLWDKAKETLGHCKKMYKVRRER